MWRRDKSGLEFRPVGQAPQAHCPHPNFGNIDYSLHIEETREDDAGVYRCEVDGQYSKEVMLYVIKGNISPAHIIVLISIIQYLQYEEGSTSISISNYKMGADIGESLRLYISIMKLL